MVTKKFTHRYFICQRTYCCFAHQKLRRVVFSKLRLSFLSDIRITIKCDSLDLATQISFRGDDCFPNSTIWGNMMLVSVCSPFTPHPFLRSISGFANPGFLGGDQDWTPATDSPSGALKSSGASTSIDTSSRTQLPLKGHPPVDTPLQGSSQPANSPLPTDRQAEQGRQHEQHPSNLGGKIVIISRSFNLRPKLPIRGYGDF